MAKVAVIVDNGGDVSIHYINDGYLQEFLQYLSEIKADDKKAKRQDYLDMDDPLHWMNDPASWD